LPLQILCAAIGLINLADDIVPSIIKFTEFLRLVLDVYEQVRDFIFYPLSYMFSSVFNIEFPDWCKSYILFGILFFGAGLASWRKNWGPIQLKDIDGWNIYTAILMGFFGWPLLPYFMVESFIMKYFRGNGDKVWMDWGVNLLRIIIVALLVIFINWTLIRVSAGLEVIQ